MRRRLAVFFFALCLTWPLLAQATDSAGGGKDWDRILGSIGRFETIAVGSFPLSLFYAGFGFDAFSYVSNGFDPLYAPWPFKSDLAPAPTDSEKFARLSTAVIISLCIASIDAILLPRALNRKNSLREPGGFTVTESQPSRGDLPQAGDPKTAPKDPGQDSLSEPEAGDKPQASGTGG